ncbi:MAG: hypothetical protein HY096_01015 [Nitrospinae bacterium]|nr:hypothetical protein [Nitrospinota bacterium]
MEKSVCPKCENKYFTMTFHSTVQFLSNNTTKIKQKDPYRKSKEKLRREHFVGMEKNSKGDLMIKERLIDKDSSIYYEFVKNPDTGEVTRLCKESLKEHMDHGSAKNKK